MFEKGDKIRCIDNTDRGYQEINLTRDKIYKVIIQNKKDIVRVKNDNDKEFGYIVSRFVLVSKAKRSNANCYY